jgi:cytidylate kinase
VAQRLAAALGWELLDRELLHQAAAVEHVPDADLEQLDEQALSLFDRLSWHPPHQRYMHGVTEVVRRAAERGNVVLVGRGARQLLGDRPDALHLRLVAPREWRVQRMAQREGWPHQQALDRCEVIDRTRERFSCYFFGTTGSRPEQYDLVVNTAWVPLDDVVRCVVALARGEAAGPPVFFSPSPWVLTLSRELAAGEEGVVAGLAARLGLRVYDRELLEQEARLLGLTEADLAQLDEQPAGLMQRLRPDSLHQRYFETLARLMNDLARQGNVLLVGRGGSRILREHPWAFHVRLVASPRSRARRIMLQRWVREEQARKLIAQSDARRGRFYEHYFSADWRSPLEYHLTVNGGRLGPAAADLIVLAAGCFWGRVTNDPTQEVPS